MKWNVNWEKWTFDKNSEIVSINYLSNFTIEAASLNEAVDVAGAEASKELDKRRKETPNYFLPEFDYVPHVIGLTNEAGVYHKLYPRREVFHGTIRDMDSYGDPDWGPERDAREMKEAEERFKKRNEK